MEAKGDKFSAAVGKTCPVYRTSTRQERTDMTMRRPLALLLTMILVIHVTTARAGFITFTDETLFQAAVSGAVTDTFDDLVINNTVSSPLTRTVGSYQYTATAATGNFYTVGSAGDVWLSTDNATVSLGFSINLGSPTAMGGFFFDSDSSGNAALGAISVSINGGQFLQTVSTSSATNFFGWVSDDNTPITNFQVSTSTPSRYATVNDLVFAQATSSTVPEIDPAGMGSVLALLGGGLGLLERRRRRA